MKASSDPASLQTRDGERDGEKSIIYRTDSPAASEKKVYERHKDSARSVPLLCQRKAER